MNLNIPGFSQLISQPDHGCFGIFGGEGSGKTRLCCTATQWAADRGKIPGWLVCDRKTRKTIKDYHEEMGLELPAINQADFLSPQQAIALATNTNYDEVKKVYESVITKVLEAVAKLAAVDKIEPIVIDSGTWVWDAIAFSHFGRKQDVGFSRVWGPPKQDFTDLMDSLNHKLTLITLKAKDEYKNDKRTNRQTWDGPPHLGYCTTSVIRCNFDAHQQVDYYWDKFSVDVVESQDNVGQAGVNGVLTGQAITLESLMAILRPGE